MGVVAVRFRYLDRWNVSYFKSGPWHWSRDVIKRVSQFSIPESVSIPLGDAKKRKIPIISKISFSGELFLRPHEDYDHYKGRLFLVQPGRIIFSKINARKGCILFTSKEQGEFVVSGEYPILRLDTNLALGEYVNLALRVGKAREQLMGSAAGMAKARTYLPDFQSIEMPLPPLDTQRAIVARWQSAQRIAAQAEEKIAELEKGIEKQFFADLGLKASPHFQNPKVFAARWKDFERWSVSYNQAVLSSVDISHGKYPVTELGNILSMVQYGSSEKATTEKSGTPVVRMNNIVNGVLNLSNLKYIRLPQKDLDRLLLKDGDILFNRTNSKELVGKCGVFHEEGDYIFASYLIRIRAEENQADPDYVSFVLNNRIGRQQINALSRQIIGQANVNSQELRSLKFPLPPLKIQQEIMAHVEAGRAEIARQKELAAKIRKDAETEVEALILGTKKI